MYVEIEDTPYAGLVQHHIRIGDTFCFVPPTSIQIGHAMKNNKAYILRARHPQLEESGFVERRITINLFFANLDAINNELRPLIAQIRKCPFLPVENVYLNEAHGISAITIDNIAVSNVDGFPNCLQVQIDCSPFNAQAVLNDPLGRSYDQMINWDKFRWYYKQSLRHDLRYSVVTHYQMLTEELDDTYTFYMANEKSLEAIRQWRKDKMKLIYGRETEKSNKTRDPFGNFKSDSEDYQDFVDKYQELATQVALYEEIEYIPYDYPSLIMTGFSYSVANNIVSIPMQMLEDPMHQFMGAQDMKVVLNFETTDMDAVTYMNAMMLKNQRLLRDYHAEMPYGLLKLDTQMTRLLGAEHLSVEDVQFVASNEHTGIYTIQVVGTIFKKIDRKVTEMQWINGENSPYRDRLADSEGKDVFNWDINKYADQSWFGRIIPDIKRYEIFGEELKEVDAMDISQWDKMQERNSILRQHNVGSRNLFGLSDSPIGQKWRVTQDRIFKGFSDIDSFDRKKSLEQEHYVKESMAMFELYPDLELPSWAEYAEEFGEEIPAGAGAFLDPDFFIDYAEDSLLVTDIIGSLMASTEGYNEEASEIAKKDLTVFEDPFGGTVEYDKNNQSFGEVSGYKESFEDLESRAAELDKKAKDYAAEQEKAKGSSDQSTVIQEEYKVNMPASDSEAYIRQMAESNPSVSQSYAVAFAKVDNKEFQQYFKKGSNSGLGNKKGDNDKLVVGFKKGNSSTKTSLNIIGSTNDTKADSGKATHIGIMKVPATNNAATPSQAIYLPSENIKYGVEVLGKSVDAVVAQMGKDQMKADRLAAARKYFSDIHNYDYPNDNQVKYALATLHHMGEVQAVSLILKGSTPDKIDSGAIKFAHAVNLEMIGDSSSIWNAKDLKSKTANIKIPDYSVEEDQEVKPEDKPDDIAGSPVEDMQIQNSAFADMIQHDKRGRLIRCFPTMMAMFIDEGRYIQSVKMADNFFNYQAFESITYINNRKDASSTCYIELNNINQNLTDASKNVDVQESSTWAFLRSFMGAGEMAFAEQRSRNNETYETMKSVSLTTGTRFHLRMGYGSDGRALPTIMNGTITSIQNDGPRMTLIIQDDGIELAGKLKAKPNDSSSNGWFSTKDEPSEIVNYLLHDTNHGLWFDIKRRFSNETYRESSLGIRHFGWHNAEIAWKLTKSTALGSLAGIGAGALAGAGVGAMFGGFPGAMIGGLAGLVGGGFVGGKVAYRNLSLRNPTEIDMNIHPHSGMSRTDQVDQGLFESALQLFGMSLAGNEEFNINISFFDKSMWDILNICAATDQDHIVAVHPFDFRSTIFSGRPTYPVKVAYQYNPDVADAYGTEASDFASFTTFEEKQFRQLRMYDSYSSISSNTMSSSEKNIYNVATPIYLNEGELVSAPTLYVDKNIYTDRQKHVNIDTAINAKGLWGLDMVPIVGNALNKPAEYYFDEGVAVRIAASGLRDFMKDMYDGYITVIGDPSTKPYDMAWIDDTYLKIKGPVEIKEVVHMMDYENGFITMIKPDLVVVTRDLKQVLTPIVMLTSAAASIVAGFLTRFALTRMMKMSPKSSLAHVMWAMSKSGFNINKKLLVGGFNLSNTVFDKVTGRKISPQERKEKYAARQQKYTADSLIKTFRSDEGLVKKYWNIGADKFKDLAGRLKGRVSISTASSALRIGTSQTSAAKVAGVIKNAKKLSWLAALSPPGMLAKIAEAGLFVVGGSMVKEFIMRSSFYENACMIIPVRKGEIPWTSGMQGAGASVFGRAAKQTLKQRILGWGAVDVAAQIFLGVSTKEASQPFQDFDGIADAIFESYGDDKLVQEHVEKSKPYYRYLNPLIQDKVQKAEKQGITVDYDTMKVWVADASADYLINKVIPTPRNLENAIDYNVEMYKERQMRVYQTLEDRMNLNIDRSGRVALDIESQDEGELNILEKLKDSVSNLFSSLFGFIKNLAGGNSGSSCGNGITLDGKFKVTHAASIKNFEYLSPLIEKEAQAQGAGQYTELLKAITMQESSGNYKTTPDVMQSSESIDGNLGNIKAVEASIKQGIKHFLKCISVAKGDLSIAVQSYNFGTGFAKFALERGGYSKQVASDFSDMWRKKKGWKRYGDKSYVDNVLRYYEGTLGTVECSENSFESAAGLASKCPSIKKGGGYYANLNPHKTKNRRDMVLVTQSMVESNVVLNRTDFFAKPGAVEILNKVAKEWKTVMPGDKITINSMHRMDAEAYSWHDTGWAMDINVTNSVRKGGRWVSPSKAVGNRNEKLIRLFLKHGYRTIYFADDTIVPKLNKEYGDPDGYGGWTIRSEEKNHYHHIHVSYPICK